MKQVSVLKVAIEMINADPLYSVEFNYTIIDTGLNYKSCENKAKVSFGDNSRAYSGHKNRYRIFLSFSTCSY